MSSIRGLRESIYNSIPSIGTWMQIPSPEIAEILSALKVYEWIVIDMEHGSFSRSQLPSIIRAINLNSTLPFVRLQSKEISAVKDVVDCGFLGYIIPMVETRKEIDDIFNATNYPPLGNRGVGFSRSNQYGINFDIALENNERPFLVAMIETKSAIENLDEILSSENLDCILVGPYDLSASLGICGDFESHIFKNAISKIKNSCNQYNVPFGIHLIEPSSLKLKKLIEEGAKFIAYSIDTVMVYQNKPNL